MIYIVCYYGQNIANGSIAIANLMTTIDLPAVDSDVHVTVTAMNVFGLGPSSNIVAMDKISELALNVLCMYYEHTYSTYVRTYMHTFCLRYVYTYVC